METARVVLDYRQVWVPDHIRKRAGPDWRRSLAKDQQAIDVGKQLRTDNLPGQRQISIRRDEREKREGLINQKTRRCQMTIQWKK